MKLQLKHSSIFLLFFFFVLPVEAIQLTITPNEVTKPYYSDVRSANITWKANGSTTSKCDFSWEKREKWMLSNGNGSSPQTSCSGNFTFTYRSVPNGTYQGIVKVCSCIPYSRYPNVCQESKSTDCDTKTLKITIGSSSGGSSNPPPPSDNTPPSINITSPTSSSNYSTSSRNITIRGNAYDQGKIHSIKFYRNGNYLNTINVDSKSYNWSKTISLQEGDNVITVKAYDQMGNSRKRYLTVTRAMPDNINPTINITSPTSNSNYSTSNSTITVSGNASDQGKLSRIEFYSNGNRISTSSNVNSTSYNWSKTFSLQKGNNIITVKAYDIAGNQRSDTFTIKKTTTFWGHPKIEIVDAPSTARVGQPYTIRLRATDPNSNLRKIKVDWRAIGNWETRYASNGQTVSLTYRYPRSGSFSWVALAEDSSGKQSYAVSRSVTVKSSYPTARYTGYNTSSRLRRSQPAQCRSNCLVADPIDTATGAQVLTHELLSVKGVLPISATLNYNSLLLTKGVTGRSWNLNNFDTQLQALPSGDIEVHWSANRSNVFKHRGNGKFTGTDLVTLYDTLVTNADDSFTLTRQNKTTYQFDSNGWLVALRNQQSQAIEFKRDNTGRLLQVIEPVSGVFLKYAYNSQGLLTTLSDSLNRQVHLGYDNDHNLTTITDAAGKTTTYTYNEFGQTLTGTNGDGVRLFTNTYDSEGRIITQDDGIKDNQLFQLSYDETDQRSNTTVTDRNGNESIYTYADNYQLVSLQNALGATTYYNYVFGRRVTETNAKGSITRFTYDANGHLVAVTNPANLKTHLSYDSRGNLLTVTNHAQQTTAFAYDAHNNVISQTSPNGQITRFKYNAQQQLVKVILPKGATTTYAYRKGRIATITDAKGNTQTLDYDNAGRVISVTDENKKTTTLTYDPLDRIVSVTDSLNRKVYMTYDSRNNLVTFKDVKGQVTQRIFDRNGNLKTLIDALNRQTHYEYNGEDQLIKLTDANHHTSEIQRDALGRVVNAISPNGSEKQWAYDPLGNVIKTIDELGQAVEVSYGVLNQPVEIVDAEGFSTQFTYDALGRLIKTEDALGFSTHQTFDVNGNVLIQQDKNGHVTHYAYDAHNNLIRVEDVLGNVTKYQYDVLDRLQAIIDAKGNKTSLVYDAKGRLIKTVNPLGHKQKRNYDAVDRLVKMTDALGNTMQTRYDKADNPIQVADALGRVTGFDYNAVNRLTQIQDALQRVTTLEYDELDQLIASVDALNGRSSQAFNSEGQRTELVDPNGHKTKFEFDKKGRLVANVISSGGRQTYGYNAKDLLTEITNARGQVRQIQHDAIGRIVEITDADGTITYSYDANNNILTVTDATGTIQREYDALNRVVKYTDTKGNILQYVYDAVGNLATLVYPDGKAVNYAYDKANQLVQVTDWAGRVTSYEWNANGQLVREIRPNGTVMTRSYDRAGQLVRQVDISGEVITDFTFRYDKVGNIRDEQPTLKPPVLDATMSYTDANRLASYNGEAVDFDADGNMIRGPLDSSMQAFQFDSRNRLSQVGDTGYFYNAENYRVAVKSQGKMTRYVVNPQAVLSQVLVKDDSDGTSIFYVYGLGLIGEETGGSYQAYHYDLRGSTVALTDISGDVVERFEYSIFAQLVSGDSSMTPFLYNGRDGVMSDGNGLYYMRARFYSPEIRRFVNQDILLGNVGDGQSLNRYAYVEGNPVSFIDPFGLYGENVHYWGTYDIAKYAGFNESNANTIAKANLNMDLNWGTSPYNPFSLKYHFPAKNVYEKTVRNSQWASKPLESAIRKGNLTEIGSTLHSYQDSWSHENYSAYFNNGIAGTAAYTGGMSFGFAGAVVFGIAGTVADSGHLLARREPDNTTLSKYYDRDMEMFKFTYNKLKEAKTGVKCNESLPKELQAKLEGRRNNLHELDGTLERRRKIEKQSRSDSYNGWCSSHELNTLNCLFPGKGIPTYPFY